MLCPQKSGTVFWKKATSPIFGDIASFLGKLVSYLNYFCTCYGRSRCGHYIFVLWFLLSSVFPRLISASQSGCLPYFDTWCGLSANLECRSEMCCIRLAGNTGCKNRHLQTIAQLSGWIFASKTCIDELQIFCTQDLSFPRTKGPYGELSLRKVPGNFPEFPRPFVPRPFVPGNIHSHICMRCFIT